MKIWVSQSTSLKSTYWTSAPNAFIKNFLLSQILSVNLLHLSFRLVFYVLYFNWNLIYPFHFIFVPFHFNCHSTFFFFSLFVFLTFLFFISLLTVFSLGPLIRWNISLSWKAQCSRCQCNWQNSWEISIRPGLTWPSPWRSHPWHSWIGLASGGWSSWLESLQRWSPWRSRRGCRRRRKAWCCRTQFWPEKI